MNFTYDALGRRIREGPIVLRGSTTMDETTIELYYSKAWQVIHERKEVEGGGGSSGTIGEEESLGPDGGTSIFEQQTDYVWSLAYVDALVLRDRDINLDTVMDQRVYVQQDANFNVTAIIEADGDVVERFIYDSYGAFTVLDFNWASASLDQRSNFLCDIEAVPFAIRACRKLHVWRLELWGKSGAKRALETVQSRIRTQCEVSWYVLITSVINPLS